MPLPKAGSMTHEKPIKVSPKSGGTTVRTGTTGNRGRADAKASTNKRLQGMHGPQGGMH